MAPGFPQLFVRVALLSTVGALLAPMPALAADRLTISPESADFGQVPSGLIHGWQLTVTNVSPTAVLLGDIDVEGDSEPFSVDDGHGCANVLELETGESCDVKVSFRAPMVTADYEAVLVVEGEGVDPATASLTASSFLDGYLASDVAKVEVGPTLIGATSEPHSVRVRNAGDSPVAISSSGIPGLPSTNPFEVVENDCVGILDPAQECTIVVVFSPIAAWGPGLQGAALFVHYPGDFLLIPLNGEAASSLPEAAPPGTPPSTVPDPKPIASAAGPEIALGELTDAIPALIKGGPARRLALPKFKSAAPGRLSLVVFSRQRGKRVRIGGGRLRVAASVEQQMWFRLNKKGRVLLRRPRRTQIQVVATFEPARGLVSRHTAKYMVDAPKKKPKRR